MREDRSSWKSLPATINYKKLSLLLIWNTWTYIKLEEAKLPLIMKDSKEFKLTIKENINSIQWIREVTTFDEYISEFQINSLFKV